MKQYTPMNFNRLLDYRSWEYLSQMDDRGRADLFAELCRKKPSEETWQAIWELFALWSESAEKAKYLDVAERELASWDDRLRFVWAANAFLYDGEHLSSLVRLVRSIHIYRREEHGSTELRAI